VDSPSFRRLFVVHTAVLPENGRAGNEVAGRTLTFHMGILSLYGKRKGPT
jgi:hypothetical protein